MTAHTPNSSEQTRELPNPKGIDALACTAFDFASLLPCTFLFRYHRGRMLATASLRVSIPIHGYPDEQFFTLLYDAHNLVPKTITLESPPPTCLSLSQISYITREGEPDLVSLSLTLRKPCPFLRPLLLENVVYDASSYNSFHSFTHFITLARATQIHVFFDRNWFSRKKHEEFEAIFAESEKFHGFQVAGHAARGLGLADSFLCLTQDTSVHEPPPSYTQTEAPKKRFRQQISRSPTPPRAKRIRQSSAPISIPSITEKATTQSISGPLSLPPTSTVTQIQQAIEAAVRNVLPDVLAEILPDILIKVLPDLLPPLLRVPSSSRSSSISQDSRSSRPRIHKSKSLGAILSKEVATRLEFKVDAVCINMADHAAALRSAADDEFNEVVEDQKVDFQINKADTIAELYRESDAKLEEFREDIAEALEDAREQVEQVAAELVEQTMEHVKSDLKTGTRLGQQFEGMAQDDSDICKISRARRATSLP